MCTRVQYGKQVMENGSPMKHEHPFGTCFPQCGKQVPKRGHIFIGDPFSTLWKTGVQYGKRVPYKYVPPFLDTGAHIYRGPVFHHLFTTLAPVFCFETVYTHTQTSGNVLSKSGVRLALAAPV